MNRVATLAALAVLAAAPLRAQGRDQVPASHRPPAGMCRIWLDGVPPNQQPAPTDCATAVRNRPQNGRIVFGEPSPSTSLPVRSWRAPAPRSEPAPADTAKARPKNEPQKSEKRRKP